MPHEPRLREPSIKTCILCFVAATVCCIGCQSNPEVSRLEHEARAQRNELQQLTAELEQTRGQLAEQDRELASLRKTGQGNISLASASKSTGSFQEKAAWARVAELQIHRLTSAILATETNDAELNLVVRPLDSDGEAVKLSGELKVVVTSTSGSTHIAQRKLSLSEFRQAWHSSLFASGIAITIPLGPMQTLPDSVTAIASFEPAPGQTFETSMEFKVR